MNLRSPTQQISAPFDITVNCLHTEPIICQKAERAFKKAADIISDVILFKEPVKVNATMMSFCKALNECGTGMLTLGGSSPARAMPLLNNDGLFRLHPQALVKQFGLDDHPAYAPFDILSIFNADAPFWFQEDNVPIDPIQADFMFVILHEFMHGLGFYSGWNEYISSEAITPDPSPFMSNQLMLMLNPTTTAIHPNQFLESAMDRLLKIIKVDDKPTSIAVSDFTRKLNSIDVNNLQQLVLDPKFSFARDMNRYATVEGSLGIESSDEEVIVLETALKPFQSGSSVSHVAYQKYTSSKDFLMRFMQDRGVTLEDAVKRGGGTGPIGPLLLRVFEELGYATVDSPDTVPPLLIFQDSNHSQYGTQKKFAKEHFTSTAVHTEINIMGKQVRKTFKPRPNPIGNKEEPATLENGEQQLTLQPDQVLPVVQKLASLDATERGWAAACVSNLIMGSDENLKLLLSKGVVGSLIKLLSDETREVVEEALGTLRNLCALEPEVCQEYFSKDILTPLGVILPQISQVIDLVLRDAPFVDNADQDRRSSIWDVAENFIYIIWSLSEASDKHIKAINRLNIVTFLISFLSAADQCPTHVVVAAGQCLTTLTDDNKDIYIEFKNHPEYVQMLLNILNKFESPDKLLVRVLACAILMNVREVVQLSGSWDDERDALGELNKTVMPILIASLDYDIQQAAEEVKQVIESGNVTKPEESTEITAKPKQPLTKGDIYIQTVEERLTTLQLSLELLAGICLQDDTEEDGWEDAGEDMEQDQDAEEMTDNLNEDNVDDYLREAESLGDNTSTAVDEAVARSNPVINNFSINIFPQLVQLATPTSVSFPQDATFAPGVTQGLVLTHQRALECLNNFLLAMNEVPSKFWFKEHVDDAKKTWSWLFQNAILIGTAPASEERDSIIEAIVSCLWSLGRGLGQNIPLEPNHVPALCGAFRASTSESMQVKIVGCLGPIAVRQGDINTNKDIGIFIMEVLGNIGSHKTQPDVAVEALNLVFDVYSDCAFDYDTPVYVQGKFNNQLKQLLPSVKAMVKSTDRRKNFDLRNRCDEALMNLVAFIKYKASEKR
ncbi:hypothetical protein HPULCUR_007335 [Helicostylum pulchrum]|uniref:SYO1-like TPR repeats domain-containing protein n=1 Tax=Helicostylum pulchrum TaxID=562976 RepID=A0ABP9Y5M6_9FUNG